jgi:hypothetical protein
MLQDQIADPALAVPTGPQPEMPLDFYGKKPRVSLKMLISFCTPLVYLIASTMSSRKGDEGLFPLDMSSPPGTNPPHPSDLPRRPQAVRPLNLRI